MGPQTLVFLDKSVRLFSLQSGNFLVEPDVQLWERQEVFHNARLHLLQIAAR